jgi:hypothetical protein
MIDENLSWEEHVNYIYKKVAKGLGMLRRIRDLVPINTLIDIYSSIILPHFDYCSSVWDNCRNRVAKKLRARGHCPRGRFTIGEVSEEGLVANGH